MMLPMTDDVVRSFNSGRIFKVSVEWASTLGPRPPLTPPTHCSARQHDTTAAPLPSHCLSAPQNNEAPVNSIDFHRTHDLLVTAAGDGLVQVYDTAEGRHLTTVPAHQTGCQNVVWTHAADKILFASNKVCVRAEAVVCAATGCSGTHQQPRAP
jgi:WD40 repeat protein